MQNHSHLDQKYFIDEDTYNCPFCNRNNLPYKMFGKQSFDWSKTIKCYVYFVRCSYCEGESMHLSYCDIAEYESYQHYEFNDNIEIDDLIFYSQPTSFFVLDKRIPAVIRELVAEAESCLKMNLLTGASACTRKAIYELIKKENAEGTDYESRIKSLKGKYPDCDPDYFDILSAIQDMTSEKVHEQSWPKWDSKHLKLIINTVKTILHEIYVEPELKSERSTRIKKLREQVKKEKKAGSDGSSTEQESA